MIRFECDYAEGAHSKILDALVKTNLEQTPGYGVDTFCENARRLIRKECDAADADVHFFVGGTQANKTVIAAVLRPHQGVVSACTGHINVHETGAIEATGHKVITLPSDDGKITAEQIQAAYDCHWNDVNHEHVVQPGMVYISNPTENGTLYTKSELEAISSTCRKLSLPLFLDGARLGYGLAAQGNDLFLPDYARLCDIFYIGGTKVGALFGEALVISEKSLNKDFRYFLKQNGGMLAKGRLLGIQFETLFTDNLYLEISKHAISLAMKIKAGFSNIGCKFRYDSSTNQQFPILPNELMKKLESSYAFSFWETVDKNHTAVRFCTSWATTEADVEKLLADISK